MRYTKFTLLLMLVLLLGCTNNNTKADTTTDTGVLAAYTQENNATVIAFDNFQALISGSGAEFSDGILSIRQAGTYMLSGRLENGQVLVNVARNDTVSLVLNGVTLHNETGPAIYAPRSKEVILILEDGTQNTVSDGSFPRDDSEINSAIYVQHNLSITGGGILFVTGNYRHGIRAQDFLTIAEGVINVNSAGDALRGRDGITIQNGIFTLNSGGDGIQSNNANSDDVGFVTINGGTFAIQAQNDGIQAESVLTITGGRFNITTGGGRAAAPARTATRGGRGFIRQTVEESASMKGLKAVKLVNISGGEFVIDARDDGVHSDGGIIINSGALFIKTGDDAIHADGAVLLTGGEIDIRDCYEGIEGMSVTIRGGNISIVSRDDAINAAGGSSLNSMFVRISGGTIDLHSLADGIDSNGNIFLEGGTLKISGPSQIMEGAIDFDGTFTVTGGELITAGSIQPASQNSTQPVILVSYTGQQPSGSVIAIKDSAGNVLLEYTSKNVFSYSGFTSPSFRTGGTYSLFINGVKRSDIRLNGIVTRTSDTGGAYNEGRGGRSPRR